MANKKIEGKPYFRVYLKIRGGRTPHEISELTGLLPDESWAEGDPMPYVSNASGARRYGFTLWQLNSNMQMYSYELEEYIKNLWARISKASQKIMKLDRRIYDVTVQVELDITTNGSMPVLSLSPQIMKAMSDVGAQLDVDMYAYAELPKYALAALKKFKGELPMNS